MAAPSRVDELRKRYHENPRRFFAPLANEYRKTGFLDRAILLCEKHLAEQPDNLNGLVVYGQTLFESGRHGDAKAPFEMALNLDQENLIALRHLGDIAKLEGDLEGARKWYERVLEFDRRNEEVLALLEEVGGGAAKEPPSGPSSAPSIVSVASSVRVTSGAMAESLGLIDLDGPAAAPTPAPAAPVAALRAPAVKTVEISAQKAPAKRASLMDIAFDFGEPAAEGPSAKAVPNAPILSAEAAEYGFAEVSPPAPTKPIVRALEEMETLVVEPPPYVRPPMVESLIEQPPEPVSLASTERIEGLEAAEFSADVSPLAGLEPSEFESGDAAPMSGLEPMEFEASSVSAPEVPGLEDREFVPPTTADEQRRKSLAGLPLIEDTPPLPRPMADLPELDTSDRAPSPPAPPIAEAETIALGAAEVRKRMETPATFVTETMAELYLKQGFRDRAADVYRQLIAQSPDDAGLKKRLEALEEAAAAPAMDFDVLPEPVEDPEPAPANAMLSEVSFADLELVTPAIPIRAATPPATPAVAPRPTAPRQAAPKPAEPTGPTAREVLAAFARRGFTPLSSPVVAGPSGRGAPVGPTDGSLDGVFGSAVDRDDEVAAHRLAGVGALAGPSGGSALDSLFGEGPSAPAPPSERTPARGGAVQRASDRLRFDQFFAAGAAPVAEPEVEPEATLEEPTLEEPSVSEPASSEPPPEDDDLDQFQGWLKRLTQ